MTIQEQTDQFLEEIEKELSGAQKNKIPFSEFLEDKMDQFDYSNTSLAKKVFHKVEKKGEDTVRYAPVTRQAIGAWLKGSKPSSREIYITLGMAFSMSLDEINYQLLETYMGYGLYCKNIDDALWIALINGLFSIDEMESVKTRIEQILEEPAEPDARSMATMDLWVMLAQTRSLTQFYDLIRRYRDEFRDGAKRFGLCLDEVIEEEYGYYEKAAWFLRDIGCLHCEAQFSKIKAGKAVVTREWLLRFCIALQPGLESIEKLLKKAQMEPLGVTPAEIIIRMIAEYKADSLEDSQKIWMMIESATAALLKKGYEIEEDLCRKYDSVRELPASQKWWFSLCIGRQLLTNQRNNNSGYDKYGYCRYIMTDRVLFEDTNRYKKNAAFKKDAGAYLAQEDRQALLSSEDTRWQEVPSLFVERGFTPDDYDLEKFEEYCYMRRPRVHSPAFRMNDVYFYCALLYSLWTGKCFQKERAAAQTEEMREEFLKNGWNADEFLALFAANIEEGSVFTKDRDVAHMMEALAAAPAGERCKNE